MPARYLLDTNVVSDFVRGDAAVQARLRGIVPTDIAVSSITVMEVTYGLELTPGRARRLRPVIDALFGAVELVPLSVEDARAAGALRAALRRRGRPIGPYDVLLAGCALARGLVFVTANSTEFARVGGLLVENWRRERES
jgi:tRNA(fMet)-specific endonuclease VapC